MNIPVSLFSTIGKKALTQTVSGTYKYYKHENNRVEELKSKGYSDEKIKKMMCFEIGFSL